MGEGSHAADLRHVDTWLFDLDDTLYPAETALMTLIRERITGFVMRIAGLDRDAARAVQQGWFETHGASLPGLLAEHDVPVADFLDEIHDVPLECVPPDPVLDAALARLPGRRLVFTNGSAGHAARVLERIGIADRFEAIFHIESGDLLPKPAVATFEKMIAVFRLDPASTAFFEDSARNLKPAHDLGITTVLVGTHAADDRSPFVDHRAPRLTPFLAEAILSTRARGDAA